MTGVRAIWAWGDLLNGIMAIPNLIALLVLAGEISRMLMRDKSGNSETLPD
jgi:Na+/alanine symporter